MTSIIETIREAVGGNSLPVLAANIKDAIARGKSANYDLCIYLADARGRFPSNNEFGKWCDENGVTLSHQDRAAAIELGQFGSERLTQIFTATTSTSIRIIRDENRVTNSGKSNQTAKPRHITPELVKVQAVYDRRKAAGESLGMTAIAKEAGTSDTPVRRVLEIVREHEAADRAEDIILSASAQERFDIKFNAAIKKHKQQLDANFDAEVSKASVAWANEYRIPSYIETLEKVKDLLQRNPKAGLISRKDFMRIIKCLHPDTPDRSKESLDAAFKIFQPLEDVLVMDAQSPLIKAVHDMPSTLEELMASRKKKRG